MTDHEASSVLRHKFPRTPHLFSVGSATDDDEECDDAQARQILAHIGRGWSPDATVIIEEKIDGANLGISFDTDSTLVFQNRSKVVTHESDSQFAKLKGWSTEHLGELYDLLTESDVPRYIVFGEWLASRHSVSYSTLPGWFIAFDVFDTATNAYLSVRDRDQRLAQCAPSLPVVRTLATVPAQLREERADASNAAVEKGRQGILRLIGDKTHYSDGPKDTMEGCYIRLERDNALVYRCKVVNKGFLNGIEQQGHWKSQSTRENILRKDVWQ